MLCLLQVYQQGAGAADAKRIRFHGIPLEAVYAKLTLQAFHGGVVHKRPFVYGRGVIVPKALLEAFLVAPLDHKFPWLHGA